MGIAISDELGMIAQPLEFIPAEPFAEFLERLKEIIQDKQVEQLVVGMPRNMDGSYGPAATKVQEFVAVLKESVAMPITLWDERLTSTQANRFLVQANVRREKRKEKVDQTAAAILLQSYLDSHTIVSGNSDKLKVQTDDCVRRDGLRGLAGAENRPRRPATGGGGAGEIVSRHGPHPQFQPDGHGRARARNGGACGDSEGRFKMPVGEAGAGAQCAFAGGHPHDVGAALSRRIFMRGSMRRANNIDTSCGTTRR